MVQGEEFGGFGRGLVGFSFVVGIGVEVVEILGRIGYECVFSIKVVDGEVLGFWLGVCDSFVCFRVWGDFIEFRQLVLNFSNGWLTFIECFLWVGVMLSSKEQLEVVVFWGIFFKNSVFLRILKIVF